MALAETAALLVSTTSPEIIKSGAYWYPLLITAFGIVVCIITAQIAFCFTSTIQKYDDLEKMISRQMWISAALLLPVIYVLSVQILPKNLKTTRVHKHLLVQAFREQKQKTHKAHKQLPPFCQNSMLRNV